MSARVSIVALALLALTGCNRDAPKQAAAPAAPAAPAESAAATRDCCCKICPTDGAPADKATASADTGASVATGSPVRRETVRVYRPAQRETRTRTYAARRHGETLAGGDYYASGATTRGYRGGYTGRDTSRSYTSRDDREYRGG
ncbi:MAG: hypothetical protein V4466_06520, partial [Pseudomonadota bacterium]